MAIDLKPYQDGVQTPLKTHPCVLSFYDLTVPKNVRLFHVFAWAATT